MKMDFNAENDEIQIDLLKLLYEFKKKIWLFVLIAILLGSAATAYSQYIIVPQYSSTAMLYVLTRETTLTSLADLQIGTQLTKDYKVMVTSRPVLEEVISSLGLDMSYKVLREKITIGNPEDTRILTLTVKDSDPVRAKVLVNQVAVTAADYIGDLMEMVPPKIIEDGEVSNIKTSPDIKKNGIIGALLGILAVCISLFVKVIFNDAIYTDAEAEQYLKLPVLAVVPNRKPNSKKEKWLKNKKGP